MKKYKKGTFAATLDLDTTKKYQFRYLADGMNWINDNEADGYIHCPYGNCDNSAIVA